MPAKSGADPRWCMRGGWIVCLVTPVVFELSMETIKTIVTKFKKDFNMYMHGVQLEIVSLCFTVGGGNPLAYT